MKKVRRVVLVILSVLAGLAVVLTILFVFRKPILGPLLKSVAENRLEQALGSGGEYDISSIGGSYITELRIQGINLAPPPDSGIREIHVDNLVVNYNPLQFMGSEPAQAVKSVFARGVRITYEPGAAPPPKNTPENAPGRAPMREPGDMLISVLDNIPDDVLVDVEGRVLLISEGSEYMIPLALKGNTSGQVRITTDLPSSLSPWTVPPLVFTRTEHSFELRSVDSPDTLGASPGGTPEIFLGASAETNSAGANVLSQVQVSFLTDTIEVRLDATPRAITAVASLSGEGTALIRTLIRRFAGRIPAIGFGTVNLQLDLETEPDAPDAFLEYLAAHPIDGQEFLSGTGEIRARDWRYRDIPVGLITGNLEWHNDILSITGLRAEAEGIFTVSAASLTLDPRKNLTPVNLEQLDVNVVDLVKFMTLLGQGDLPFSDILGMGLPSSFQNAGPRNGGYLALTISAPPGNVHTMNVQSPELPFQNLPFSISTGDISFRNGKIIIGRFRANAGESFNLEVTNLALDPARKYAPTGLDAVSLRVTDAQALARLLLKKDIALLGFVSGGVLTAHREEDRLLIDSFTIRGKNVSANAGGELRFIQGAGGEGPANPSLSFNLSELRAVIPKLNLTGELSGFLDLVTYSGSVSTSRLSAVFFPQGQGKSGVQSFMAAVRARAEASWRKNLVTLSVPELEALGGRLELSAENADLLTAAFRVQRISLETLASLLAAAGGGSGSMPGLTGRLTASGSFKGSLPAAGRKPPGPPDFSLTASAENLMLDGKAGTLEVAAVQDAGGLRFDELSVGLETVASVEGRGLLPFSIGPEGITLVSLTRTDFFLQGRAASLRELLPKGAREFVPDTTPEFRLSIGERPGVAELFFRAVDTGTPVSGAAAGVLPFSEYQIRATVEGFSSGTWTSRVRLLTEQNTLLSGDITIRPGTGWTLVNLPERILNAPLQGEARFFVPLERFAPFIPRVQNLSGTIEGSIRPSGTLRNPLLTGNLSIRDTSVRLAADIPSLDALSASIFFENNAFSINSFDGFLGHAPFSFNGFIDISRTLQIQEADLRFVGSRILLMQSPDLRVRADADIRVTGENGRLSVGGRMTVTDALYTKKIPLFGSSSAPSPSGALQFFSVRGPLGERTDLNVRITADETIVLDTNLYRGPFSLDLRLEGTAAVPLPSGRIFTDTGKVLLPFSTLSILDARILFTEENPFAPEVMVRGQTTMQNYNLLVNVTGNLPALEINVTSSPPLSSDRALLLLTTGSSSLNLFSSRGALETTRSVGTYIGKELLQRLIGSSDPDESTFFDRLDISVGREISRAGQETITVEYRIGRDSPWYVIVERDRRDNFNVGFAWRLWFR